MDAPGPRRSRLGLADDILLGLVVLVLVLVAMRIVGFIVGAVMFVLKWAVVAFFVVVAVRVFGGRSRERGPG